MPPGQQNPCGAGAVGAGCVMGVFFGAPAENAAVETADAKKKTPARAIDLSMGFSCVLVVANDAGRPEGTTSTPFDIRLAASSAPGRNPALPRLPRVETVLVLEHRLHPGLQ